MKTITRRNFLKAAGEAALVGTIAASFCALPAYADTSTTAKVDEVSPTGYKVNDKLILSGAVTFDENPEIIDETAYICNLNDGSKIWKLAIDKDFYPYFKELFVDHSLTLAVVYFKYMNGYDYVAPAYLIEGKNYTLISEYIIVRYCNAEGDPDFNLLLSRFSSNEKYMEVSDDGKTLKIDTNPHNYGGSDLSDALRDVDTAEGQKVVKKVNELMGLPSYVWYEMSQTRALDGTQKEVVGNLTISWTYHPNQGLEVLYIKK